ncbi:MAG TPA: protein adenylyltransferase SelO family protein, partial [Burkholderiaceae bacterium]|nr:protein adenylyltransferase SelO family protein [Burkholderiaceae bacterium]
ALLPLIGDTDAALAALEPYKSVFPAALLARLRAKLGLRDERDEDGELADALLQRMAADRVDYTIAFRRLGAFDTRIGARNDALRDLFIDREAFDAWAGRYAERLRAEVSIDAERAERMNRANPKFILRNHLAEEAIQRARAGDFGEVQRLLKVLQRPYDEQPEWSAYADFPPDWAQHIEVSCSS